MGKQQLIELLKKVFSPKGKKQSNKKTRSDSEPSLWTGFFKGNTDLTGLRMPHRGLQKPHKLR
jgi:hypothetical protein